MTSRWTSINNNYQATISIQVAKKTFWVTISLALISAMFLCKKIYNTHCASKLENLEHATNRATLDMFEFSKEMNTLLNQALRPLAEIPIEKLKLEKHTPEQLKQINIGIDMKKYDDSNVVLTTVGVIVTSVNDAVKALIDAQNSLVKLEKQEEKLVGEHTAKSLGIKIRAIAHKLDKYDYLKAFPEHAMNVMDSYHDARRGRRPDSDTALKDICDDLMTNVNKLIAAPEN